METYTNKSERMYGIDALRMLSMLFVVLLHILGAGGVLDETTELGVNYEVAWLIEVGAFCGVDCFALISGYVGVDSKAKYSNILYLWLTTLYYTVGITALFWIIDSESVELSDWKVAFSPIMQGYYWYVTCYIAMYLFIPIMNLAVAQLSQMALQIILIVQIALFSFLPTIFRLDPFCLKTGYSPLWLVVLYLVGGYINKYGMLTKCSRTTFLIGYIFLTCITWMSKVVIQVGTEMLGIEGKNGENLIIYTSPTILAAAVCLLLTFERWDVGLKSKKVIRFFSPTALSVYLIHRQPLVWNKIWFHRFEKIALLPWYFEALFVITFALLIYVGCSLIDRIRIVLFKKLRIRNRLDTLEKKLYQKIEIKYCRRID